MLWTYIFWMQTKSHRPWCNVLLMALLMLAYAPLLAQTSQWEAVHANGLHFEFPSAHRTFEVQGTRGMMYDGGNLFIALTSLPDTIQLGDAKSMEYRGYYMTVLAKILPRLNGRMVIATDTAIGERPAHYSRIEVPHGDEAMSYYELLQFFHQDSLRTLSCQFPSTDASGRESCDRFFSSITIGTTQEERAAPATRWPLVAIIAGIVLVAAFFVIRGRRLRGAGAQLSTS